MGFTARNDYGSSVTLQWRPARNCDTDSCTYDVHYWRSDSSDLTTYTTVQVGRVFIACTVQMDKVFLVWTAQINTSLACGAVQVGKLSLSCGTVQVIIIIIMILFL